MSGSVRERKFMFRENLNCNKKNNKIMQNMNNDQIGNCPTAEGDIKDFCKTNTNAKDKYNECVTNFEKHVYNCLKNSSSSAIHKQNPFTWCKTQCQPTSEYYNCEIGPPAICKHKSKKLNYNTAEPYCFES